MATVAVYTWKSIPRVRAVGLCVLLSKAKKTKRAHHCARTSELAVLTLSRSNKRASGHLNTTERHYGTMPDDKRFEDLESIGRKKTIDPKNLSDSEKAKIYDSMFEAFSGGR